MYHEEWLKVDHNTFNTCCGFGSSYYKSLSDNEWIYKTWSCPMCNKVFKEKIEKNKIMIRMLKRVNNEN